MVRVILISLGLIACFFQPAIAQNTPSKSIRIIVPFSVGGAFDILGRQFANFVEKETGKNVVVENFPGNNSIIGTKRHLQSPPNHLMLTSYGFYTAVDAGEFKFKDVTPVAVIGYAPLFFVVNKSKKFTCEKLRNPLTSYLLGHSGLEQTTGIPVRLIKEKFPNVVDVPYRGTSQISIALISNEIDATFVSGSSMIRPEYDVLANTSKNKIANVITLKECLGISRTVENQWLVFASPGSSTEFVYQMNILATRFSTSPENKDFFSEKGIVPLTGTLDQTSKYMQTELRTMYD